VYICPCIVTVYICKHKQCTYVHVSLQCTYVNINSVHMSMYRYQIAGRQNIKTGNKSFKYVAKFTHLGTTPNKLYIIFTVHFHTMFHKPTKCTFFDTILYSYLIPLHMFQSILQTIIWGFFQKLHLLHIHILSSSSYAVRSL
jgi:hypothetical protein